MVVTYFYHAIFLCAFRQHNCPLNRERAFHVPLGYAQKGNDSFLQRGILYQQHVFPGNVEWGRESWEEQNRAAVEVLEITTSQKKRLSIVHIHIHSDIRQRTPFTKVLGENLATLENKATNTKRIPWLILYSKLHTQVSWWQHEHHSYPVCCLKLSLSF